MTPVTVACVWVRGQVPYPVEYVSRLQKMVARWLDRQHRFVCLTDRIASVPSKVEPLHVPGPGQVYGWWSKVRLFDPANGLTGRVLYLDLDTVIVSSLDPIVDFPAPFALIPHEGRFEGLHGRRVVKRFNSSVMVWNAGVNERLWTSWTPAVSNRLWGDQDWIGEQCPRAATMPVEWFPRLSSVLSGPPFSDVAKVILAKKPKNDEAARKWPWFAQAWGNPIPARPMRRAS